MPSRCRPATSSATGCASWRPPWRRSARAARSRQAEYLARLEQANVANSLDNLKTFPRLRKLIERGTVAIHGAYFAVATGELLVRDEASGEFLPVAAEDHARLFAR